MNRDNKKLFLSICGVFLLAWFCQISLANSFVVRDIKVKGLERISAGTVLNYLPVQTGEELEAGDTAEVIKALYETGFFQSVSLERQGNTLIVQLVERPTINAISVTGNKEIPTDKMKELLKEMGLVKGHVFQRASLERLEKELKQAYTARGNYTASVQTKVDTLKQNMVAIKVTIAEGRTAKIREIKFIGNQSISSHQLSGEMSLASSNLLSFFTKKDLYSKSALDASLEAIRSYYLDRGYLKFEITSSDVKLSDDKKEVYITIHLKEGAQYKFSGFAIRGRTIIPEEKIKQLILVKEGETFSRKKVTESISAIGLALGDEGYGFPMVNAEPRIDEPHKTVFLTFVVDPGRHVYVRHINFHGNTKTADYVLRNVIRQDEGALLSLHNIKESERQLRVLGYLKNVNITITPVSDANNQVDLDVQVEEAPSAEASAALGYGTNGPQFNASVNQRNFMGTGRSVGLSFNASYWGQDYSFHYYNPFYTRTGIGRGINFYFQKMDPEHLDVASYSSDKIGGDVNYNLMLSEQSSLQFGYGFQNLYVKSVGAVQQIQNFVNLYGRNFNQARLTGGWNRNSYDQMPYPNKGLNQQAAFLAALPVTSDSLSYYKASYSTHLYQPVTHGFILSLLGNVGYGNGFNHQGLPFFENYYAGGIASPGQVRGYQSYSLGPQDNSGNAMGANFLVNGSAGLIMPYPLSRESFRTTAFVDAGNVFAKGTPLALRGTDNGPVRYSSGVGLEWRSPFGPLAFSVAVPLNKQPSDESQLFQFSMSSAF